MSPKAKQSKGKARLNAYEKLADQETKDREAKLELFIPPGPRLGDVVIDLEGVTKSYGDRVLIENLNLTIPKNAIVGIIGPNGVGKSTLFKMIMGRETPDQGNIHIGDTVKMSYVDQSHEALQDPEKTVYDVVSGGQDLIITLGTDEITLQNTTINDLNASDFVFV